jgi:membrane protease YdiL (CAAX protease family)
MPAVAISPAKKITRSAPPHHWDGRAYAWSAVFIGSGSPEIMCRQFGITAGTWLPLSQTIILLGLAFTAAKLCPIKNLAGFILAIAALQFGWQIAVPWIEAASVVHFASQHLNWSGRFFLSRAIRTVGAVFMIFTLIGNRPSRDELFLRIGNWRSSVKTEPFFRVRRPIPWTRFAFALLLIFGVLLPLYLYLTLHPRIQRVQEVLLVLPWAVAIAAINAANEEFQFRSVLLARLKNVIPVQEACFLTGAFFGLNHYFGQPSGWSGVFMAGIAGWIWAKSMVETRGFSCAFASHFVQDIVIFIFLAMSVATNG